MAVGLAVGGDMDQLRPGAGIGERSQKAFGEAPSVGQQILESNGAGNGAIVKEHVYEFSRGHTNWVGRGRIDSASIHLPPYPATQRPRPACLIRRENRELDTQVGKDFQS